MEKGNRTRYTGIAELAGFLVICWILTLLGPLSILLMLILPYGIARMLCTKRPWLILPLLVASPLSIGFTMGVIDYAAGKPRLMGMGLPGTEYSNIDPTTRCFRSTGGCLVSGNEWVFQTPNNLAIRMLALTLGPPSGSYDGPYPSLEEAIEASKKGTPIHPKEFVSGSIQLPDRQVQLNSNLATEIYNRCTPSFWYPDFMEAEDYADRLSVTLWQKQCLILHWQGEQFTEEAAGECIVLIDLESSRPFAVYKLTPETHMNRAVISHFWR